METVLPGLPDDALAGVFCALPPRDLAAARCVCKAWRDVVDGRALLLPSLLPSSVRGIFINYIDHRCPHLFARPWSPWTFPSVDGLFDFIPKHQKRSWWTVLDHCNGLLLCQCDNDCICNPATRQWMRLPFPPRTGSARYGNCMYLVFDPAVSPHFEVFQVPGLPEIKPPEDSPSRRRRLAAAAELDAPFCLEWLFSSSMLEPDHNEEAIISATEEEAVAVAEETMVDEGEEDTEDPCRLMEWPPSPWTLQVFSSRTGQWEQRSFVREGEAAGTVQDMHSDPLEPTWRGPHQRYAVYNDGVLYVHCRGSFVVRLSLEDGKYQLIKTPGITGEAAKPYLGRSKMGVCFGFVHECQLRVWILTESCGRMEWTLKYQEDLWKYAQHVAALPDGDGPWMVKEDYRDVWRFNGADNVKAPLEQNYDWDSDNDDDTLTIDEQHVDADYGYHFDILGFHPYKEIVFLHTRFETIACHLNSSKKVQYLGNTLPRSYHPGSQLAYGMYESFVYTPCMIGELHEVDED